MNRFTTFIRSKSAKVLDNFVRETAGYEKQCIGGGLGAICGTIVGSKNVDDFTDCKVRKTLFTTYTTICGAFLGVAAIELSWFVIPAIGVSVLANTLESNKVKKDK